MTRNRIHLFLCFFLFFFFFSCKEKNKEDEKKTKSEIKNQHQKKNNNETDSSIIEIENGIMTVKNKTNNNLSMRGPVDSLRNRNGIWYSYFPNGTVNSKTTYNINGKRHGEHLVNYPSGSVRFKGNWHNGKKSGEWFFYSKNGELKKTQVFKK